MKLNCSLGDLAITVGNEVPENSGLIVQIIGTRGLIEWRGFDCPIHVWEVEIQSPEGLLTYLYGDIVDRLRVGPAPDVYLHRILDPNLCFSNEIDLELLLLEY